MNEDLRKQILEENKRSFNVNTHADGDMDTFFAHYAAGLRQFRDRGVIEKLVQHCNRKDEVDRVDIVGGINSEEL
jgi:hypothetical protein